MPSPTFHSNSLVDYPRASRSALASLVLVAPLLLLYECGVLFQGGGAVRNGADVLLRHGLSALGLTQYFLLPLLTAAALAAWHHASRRKWTVSPVVVGGMAVECCLVAAALALAAQVSGAIVQSTTGETLGIPACSLAEADSASRAVLFAGAGVYEEALFRLLLLSALAAALVRCGMSRAPALLLGVALSSLAFAAAHHVGPHGEAFAWYPFGFRCAAGCLFAGLFVTRGFGIAAGAHAGYDMLVGLG